MSSLRFMKILQYAAVVFCMGAIGYRVITAPEIPDFAPVLSHIQTASDAGTSAMQALPGTLSHVNDATDAAKGLLQAAQPVVSGLTTTESKINAAVDLTSHQINDLCPLPAAVDAAIHPCGTLADTNRTLATLRGTSGEVEKSLFLFNRHEGELFTQESSAYGQFQTTMTDIDHVAGDKDLLAVFGNVKTISGDAAAMTTDGREWFHQKLYPTKRKGFVSGFEATGDAVKHWMPPLF